jgi:hypothetical protein
VLPPGSTVRPAAARIKAMLIINRVEVIGNDWMAYNPILGS